MYKRNCKNNKVEGEETKKWLGKFQTQKHEYTD